MVDAGPEPTYEEKMRVLPPPLGTCAPNFMSGAQLNNSLRKARKENRTPTNVKFVLYQQ